VGVWAVHELRIFLGDLLSATGGALFSNHGGRSSTGEKRRDWIALFQCSAGNTMRENRIILALVLGDDKVSSQSASLLVEVTLRTLAGDQQLAGALLWVLPCQHARPFGA
jgi:hypothetical protein